MGLVQSEEGERSEESGLSVARAADCASPEGCLLLSPNEKEPER